MSYRLLFSLLLLTVFITQFSTLGIRFNVTAPLISYGDTVMRQATSKVFVPLRNVVYNTIYTSSVEETYESIVFVGDVMMARNVEEIMKREGSDFPFAGLDLLKLSPKAAVVGNFESSMATAHVQTPTNNLKFSVNSEHLSALKDAHFTHLSLANNHSFDFDESGYVNTIEQLTSFGFKPFGHENSLSEDSVSVINTINGDVALIGVNASDGKLDKKSLFSLIKKASRTSDMQIVFIHWGIEYDGVHHVSQSKLAKEMVSAGVDLIVGHHPHVVQDIEIIDGVLVFYSLGNYVFDQYFSKEVQEGLVLAMDLTKNGNIFLLPVTSANILSQPQPMNPNEHERFLINLARKSDPKLESFIRSGVMPLEPRVATSTKIAMMTP